MILNQSISRRSNRAALPVAPAYYVTARQVRNACVIGCLAGLLFCVAVCALMP